jgi:hypothetical protein
VAHARGTSQCLKFLGHRRVEECRDYALGSARERERRRISKSQNAYPAECLAIWQGRAALPLSRPYLSFTASRGSSVRRSRNCKRLDNYEQSMHQNFPALHQMIVSEAVRIRLQAEIAPVRPVEREDQKNTERIKTARTKPSVFPENLTSNGRKNLISSNRWRPAFGLIASREFL